MDELGQKIDSGAVLHSLDKLHDHYVIDFEKNSALVDNVAVDLVLINFRP
jgi:hypothetical protein